MTHRKIRSVMTSDVLHVRSDTTFKEIATLLSGGRVSAVPVLDPAGRVIGVVSETDLLRKYDSPHAGHRPPRWPTRRRNAWTKASATSASALMSAPAITVTADASIVTAARLMAEHGIKRLPVVDTEGHLTGIISARDLVGVFVRTDEDIAAEITAEVLIRALCADPAAVTVDVHDGVATLGGQLERRSTLSVAVDLARRVDGVVDVVTHLTFAMDDSHVSDATVAQNVGALHDLWAKH